MTRTVVTGGSGKAGRAVVRDLQRLRVEPLVPVAPGTALTAVPQMELLAVIDGAAGRGGWALTDGTGSSAATSWSTWTAAGWR